MIEDAGCRPAPPVVDSRSRQPTGDAQVGWDRQRDSAALGRLVAEILVGGGRQRSYLVSSDMLIVVIFVDDRSLVILLW